MPVWAATHGKRSRLQYYLDLVCLSLYTQKCRKCSSSRPERILLTTRLFPHKCLVLLKPQLNPLKMLPPASDTAMRMSQDLCEQQEGRDSLSPSPLLSSMQSTLLPPRPLSGSPRTCSQRTLSTIATSPDQATSRTTSTSTWLSTTTSELFLAALRLLLKKLPMTKVTALLFSVMTTACLVSLISLTQWNVKAPS